MKKSSRKRELYLASLLILGGGILLSLRVGAVQGFDESIFYLLRLPRTISGFAIGGGLAVAGALIQSGLGNPLADPYTTGIASAASLGAVIGSALQAFPLLGATGGAFAFSILSLSLLTAWLKRNFRHTTEVLLVGVVSGIFFTSLSTLVLALSDPAMWSNHVAWILGSLGKLTLAQSIAVALATSALSIIAWTWWKPLDLLAVDDTLAESSGVNIHSLRKRIFLLTALITAISVSSAGVIGFIGLVVPHALRRLGVSSHRDLITLAFVNGAGLLLCSDAVARVIIRPSEIPVGVVLALIGAPAFLWIAKSQASSRGGSRT